MINLGVHLVHVSKTLLEGTVTKLVTGVVHAFLQKI